MQFLELASTIGSVWFNLDQVTSIAVNGKPSPENATIRFADGREEIVSDLNSVAALHVFLQKHKAK
jgi:hypothetical protein